MAERILIPEAKALSWFLGKRVVNTDFDLIWDEEMMELFEEKTILTKEALKCMSLISIKEAIFMERNDQENKELDDDHNISNKHQIKSNVQNISRYQGLWFTDWNAREGNHYKDTIRYCPLCLKADKIPYYRKMWRLGFVTICFTHKCFLENRCPSCHSKIAYYSLDWESDLRFCQKCGANLTNIEPKYIQNIDSQELGDYSMDNKIQSFQNYLLFETPQIIDKIIALAWFITNCCSPNDSIFQYLSIKFPADIIKSWQEYALKANKLPLFRHLQYCFLIMITASCIWQKPDLLNIFLAEYHSNQELFFTDMPFHCVVENCQYITSSFPRILTHFHQFQSVYACNICFEFLESANAIKEHLKIHGITGKNGFNSSVSNKCGYCNQEFPTPVELMNHMSLHFISRILICNECGKAFSDQYSLKVHQRKHTQERPFLCEICQKRFPTKGTLKDHIRTHTGERPYQCTLCDKKFSQSSDLAAHLRRHTGKRPFTCNFCQKSFITSSELRSHEQIHTGKRKSICEVCGKSFFSQSKLRRHTRIHTGERPYECPICYKTFIGISDLKRHRQIHDNSDRPIFQCNLCDKQNSRKDHLRRHLKSHYE